MISIVLLGTGNVASNLFEAFTKTDEVELKQVYGRNLLALEPFKNTVPSITSLDKLATADIYLLAISDGSIAQVSESLKNRNGLVVHTSGSTNMKDLKPSRRGVFYPLQTFSKGKRVDFSEIPICVEAENEKDVLLLETLGRSISNKVHRISSKQREKLHLSAVLVNNFPNHLYTIAEELCSENDISFNLLQPLISETVDKIRFLSPQEAQTGPAKRNDVMTMQHHLEQLTNPLHKKIYQLISESIKQDNEKEL